MNGVETRQGINIDESIKEGNGIRNWESANKCTAALWGDGNVSGS